MVYQVELLHDDALALLQYLERLQVLRLLAPVKQTAPKKERKSRFSGRISQATAENLQQQLAQMREEWR